MEIKEKIIVKTAELFSMMGMKALTMDMIASGLGISKRTLYEHFRDKDELLLQAIDHMIRKNNIRLMEISAQSPDVIDAIFVITEMQHRQMMTINPVIFEDMKRYMFRVNLSYYRNREKCREFSVIYHLMERGIRDGVFREDLKIDIVDLFISELVIMFHSSDALKGMKMTRQEAMVNIFIPYFRGLCTPRGIGLLETYSQRCQVEEDMKS